MSNDQIIIGVIAYHENARGQMESCAGDLLASVRRAAHRLEVLAHGVDEDGRLYAMIYHELPLQAVRLEPETQPEPDQAPEEQPKKPRRTPRRKSADKDAVQEEPDAAGDDG